MHQVMETSPYTCALHTLPPAGMPMLFAPTPHKAHPLRQVFLLQMCCSCSAASAWSLPPSLSAAMQMFPPAAIYHIQRHNCSRCKLAGQRRKHLVWPPADAVIAARSKILASSSQSGPESQSVKQRELLRFISLHEEE